MFTPINSFLPQPDFFWLRKKVAPPLPGVVSVLGVASSETAGGRGVLLKPSGLRWEERQDDP